MVSLVVIVFGLFTYSLTAAQQTGTQSALESENGLAQTQSTYKKSVTLFGKIQELKVKKQDTSKLETLYTASVQSLSSQNEKAAENQLNQLETQIVKINESLALTPSPQPSGVIASASGTVTPSPPEPSEAAEASGSADLN